MKISNVVLFNIGPYLKQNSFSFDIDSKKNIVLIGGKNGAGKTTFFKSIKTCLFGSKVWGFDAPCKEYYYIIEELINLKARTKPDLKAFIEVDLVFNDGKSISKYSLHRGWSRNNNSIKEEFIVKKDGAVLNEEETNDFIAMLLTLTPPDMFNFFFFDGESIAEFFLGPNGNKNFRKAFLSLYGLDTISLMIENFNRRSQSKISGNKNEYNIFLKLKKELNKQEFIYNQLDEEKRNIEKNRDIVEMKINSLTDQYKKSGGVSISDWKDLNSCLTNEENERNNINKWLKEIANNYLPFIILRKEIKKVKKEININWDNTNKKNMIDSLYSNDVKESIGKLIQSKKISKINAEEVIKVIENSLKIDKQRFAFDLSVTQMNKVISQINEKNEFEINSIKEQIKKLDTSINRSKQIRETLSKSNVDNFENYIKAKTNLEKELLKIEMDLDIKNQEIDSLNQLMDNTNKAIATKKQELEKALIDKSISNIAERAAASFSILEEELIRKQGSILQKEFISCFNAIINKENFIDGILIDKKINVIPFKYLTIRTLDQFLQYLQKNNNILPLLYNEEKIEKMKKKSFWKEEIKLPDPITAPFSQGERQIYIMSLYLALLKTSNRDIPFFIDTPFSRIDSHHRESIVSQFFLNLDNQMFILSTDEEIVGEYKKRLERKTSNYYELFINEYGSTCVKQNKYFGEKI